MVKRNKIISIDTEYNKNGEILSIGASNHEFKIDFFIKNKVDKKSYTFHGIAEDFLKENGLETKELKNIVSSINNNFDIIIGFDILKDLQVLNFPNISSLYTNKRIIDIKCILDLYNKNQKLNTLAKTLGVNNNIYSSLEHSSSYDSMITYLIFLKLFEIEYNNEYSFFEEFISNMSSLTSAFFWNEYHELDNFYSVFKNINSKIEKKKEEKEKKSELRYYIKDDFILFVNKNEEIQYRFPIKYLANDKLNEFEKFKGNIADTYGIKFYNKVIKKECKEYSFH